MCYFASVSPFIQEVVIEKDQLIKNTRRGDLIRVVMSVDPGTQHGLRVRAFQMTLH